MRSPTLPTPPVDSNPDDVETEVLEAPESEKQRTSSEIATTSTVVTHSTPIRESTETIEKIITPPPEDPVVPIQPIKKEEEEKAPVVPVTEPAPVVQPIVDTLNKAKTLSIDDMKNKYLKEYEKIPAERRRATAPGPLTTTKTSSGRHVTEAQERMSLPTVISPSKDYDNPFRNFNKKEEGTELTQKQKTDSLPLQPDIQQRTESAPMLRMRTPYLKKQKNSHTSAFSHIENCKTLHLQVTTLSCILLLPWVYPRKLDILSPVQFQKNKVGQLLKNKQVYKHRSIV